VSASGITLPYDQSLERVGSCGVPAMHSQARIVDPDGIEVPPGTVGEIAIKGPEVKLGWPSRTRRRRRCATAGATPATSG